MWPPPTSILPADAYRTSISSLDVVTSVTAKLSSRSRSATHFEAGSGTQAFHSQRHPRSSIALIHINIAHIGLS